MNNTNTQTNGNTMDLKAAVPPHVRKVANIVARQYGYGSATEIRCSTTGPDAPRVLHHTPYGYRKNTTGEYVPNRYRSNFGWKNTYYQAAETVVAVPVEMWQVAVCPPTSQPVAPTSCSSYACRLEY